MNNKEALKLAQQFRGHFEVFKHFEDLMAHIVSADQLIKEQQDQLSNLGPALEDAKSKIAAAQDDFKKKSADFSKRLMQRQEEFDSQVGNLSSLLQEKTKDVDDKIKKLDRLHGEVKLHHEDAVAVMSARRNELKDEIHALETKLADLKNRIGAV